MITHSVTLCAWVKFNKKQQYTAEIEQQLHELRVHALLEGWNVADELSGVADPFADVGHDFTTRLSAYLNRSKRPCDTLLVYNLVTATMSRENALLTMLQLQRDFGVSIVDIHDVYAGGMVQVVGQISEMIEGFLSATGDAGAVR